MRDVFVGRGCVKHEWTRANDGKNPDADIPEPDGVKGIMSSNYTPILPSPANSHHTTGN
jgi:hypothetical protein